MIEANQFFCDNIKNINYEAKITCEGFFILNHLMHSDYTNFQNGETYSLDFISIQEPKIIFGVHDGHNLKFYEQKLSLTTEKEIKDAIELLDKPKNDELRVSNLRLEKVTFEYIEGQSLNDATIMSIYNVEGVLVAYKLNGTIEQIINDKTYDETDDPTPDEKAAKAKAEEKAAKAKKEAAEAAEAAKEAAEAANEADAEFHGEESDGKESDGEESDEEESDFPSDSDGEESDGKELGREEEEL
ncbi:MAG: hypothetical protein ACON4U_02160, partial [Myxococcota bacterium]